VPAHLLLPWPSLPLPPPLALLLELFRHVLLGSLPVLVHPLVPLPPGVQAPAGPALPAPPVQPGTGCACQGQVL